MFLSIIQVKKNKGFLANSVAYQELCATVLDLKIFSKFLYCNILLFLCRLRLFEQVQIMEISYFKYKLPTKNKLEMGTNIFIAQRSHFCTRSQF